MSRRTAGIPPTYSSPPGGANGGGGNDKEISGRILLKQQFGYVWPMTKTLGPFDYVIVGAGTAGCVLAN
ncbi:MAG: hypothetical protein O7A62_09545, partial [Alphaproteobacteria bacterium]|nr:hypothetical protein [Alphaproteobacteria bacterium]